MSHELKEGVYLKSIFWPEGDVTIGKHGCTSLFVRMQMGQMSMVPWAEATFENGTKQLYNLALAEGATVSEEQKQ